MVLGHIMRFDSQGKWMHLDDRLMIALSPETDAMFSSGGRLGASKIEFHNPLYIAYQHDIPKCQVPCQMSTSPLNL